MKVTEHFLLFVLFTFTAFLNVNFRNPNTCMKVKSVFCYNGREINKYIIMNIFEADKSFSLETNI